MDNDKLTQKNKVILNGRVYPAIQACVSNRYKIVLGIFAYYSFIFTSGDFCKKFECSNINIYVSIIFTFFVLHNLVNYWLNNSEELKIETNSEIKRIDFKEWPWMEISFAVTASLLIWGGYFFVK